MRPSSRVPLHVQVDGDGIVLVLDKSFETWADRWSPVIIGRYPGPYRTARIDCSRCNRLTSAFFAGAIHLRQAYGPDVTVILDQLDPALIRGLATMRIQSLFTVVTRSSAAS